MKLLALNQPVAVDLRLVMAALTITNATANGTLHQGIQISNVQSALMAGVNISNVDDWGLDLYNVAIDISDSMISNTSDDGIHAIRSNLSGSNTRMYNNSESMYVEHPSLISIFNFIFDNPSGAPYQNFSNLSINDSTASGESYYLNWTSSAPPAGFISFEQKWVEIKNNSAGVSLDSIVWHWTDAEAASYDEEDLELWKNNGTWSGEILDPDTGANTLSTTNLNPSSDYGIVIDITPPSVSIESPENITYSTTTIPLNYTATDNGAIDSCWYVVDDEPSMPLPGCLNITMDPLSEGPHNVTVFVNDSADNRDNETVYFTIVIPPDDEQEPGKDSMSFSYDFSCPGDVVEFEAKRSPTKPLPGVKIKIIYDDTATIVDTLTTDSDGKASIVLSEEGLYKITASKTDFVTVHKSFEFELCPFICGSDDECADDEQCIDGTCIPVECPECGEISEHQCTAYQCCADEDCAEGQVCEENQCITPYECASGADCEDSEYCDVAPGEAGGSCEPVTGECGYAADHEWVTYECGDEPGCPECPAGAVCEERQCVQKGIECPSTGFVGTEYTCRFTSDGGPCAGCDVRVTLPDGTVVLGQTDGQGDYTFIPEQEGEYRIDILSNGVVVLSSTFSPLPLPEIFAELALPDWCLPVGAVVLVMALLLLWWAKKKREAPKKAGKSAK